MLGTLVDRAVRPLARMLDAGYMRRLGIANTMRLARGYNRLKYGRHQRFRLDQAHHLESVLQQPSARLPSIRMPDGWAIDTSGSLPFLEAVIEAGERVIAKRGGNGPSRPDPRAFIQNIIKRDDVLEHPAILDFATAPAVLKPVIEYMGFVPRLSRDLPPGVRLTESSRAFDPTPDAPPRESQLFHLDIHDQPMIYVVVAIRDITPEQGPFCFLPRGVSEKAARALGYQRRGRPYRLTDDVVYNVVDRKELIEFACPKGTVLFVDSSRCFHFGSRNAVVPRYQFMFAYVSACRTDFAEVYMQPQAYPPPSDSPLLRKMVLDQHYRD